MIMSRRMALWEKSSGKDRLWNALEPTRVFYPHELRQPPRNLNLEILCAGLGGEIRGLQSLGFGFQILGLAEKNVQRRKSCFSISVIAANA